MLQWYHFIIAFLYRRCARVYLSQGAIAFLYRGCARVYLFPKCDRLSVSVDAIASILLKVRSCLSFPRCDRLYMSVDAIRLRDSYASPVSLPLQHYALPNTRLLLAPFVVTHRPSKR